MKRYKQIREKELTYRQREALPDSAFVFPKERKYPIHDIAHARNALARVSQHGTPEEQKKVKAAVETKYPELKESHSTSIEDCYKMSMSKSTKENQIFNFIQLAYALGHDTNKVQKALKDLFQLSTKEIKQAWDNYKENPMGVVI